MDPSLSGGVRPTKKSSHGSSRIGISGLLKTVYIGNRCIIKGLGAVLSQKGDDNEIHVVAYVSRSL